MASCVFDGLFSGQLCFFGSKASKGEEEGLEQANDRYPNYPLSFFFLTR